MPVSLKCDVDANPKALPVWQKDDTSPPVQQTPDGFLNFTEIRREHSGWYKCISRHHEMEVTQEPDFDIGELSSTGRQLEVSLGGAVQLACPPGTTGCWTRVEPGTGKLEPMGASQELRLDNVLYQEGGEYSESLSRSFGWYDCDEAASQQYHHRQLQPNTMDASNRQMMNFPRRQRRTARAHRLSFVICWRHINFYETIESDTLFPVKRSIQ
ncbi:unnamed protein product [Brassicogethes aeneus]|uniref:Ig-like domain-containing protein n=1 Tax=Brassicogethes aeneus TaxID=1431903 RepID=A0A9P0AKS0_BRAAE|nr:unnamed protein product [Brassicogethes aeneus]